MSYGEFSLSKFDPVSTSISRVSTVLVVVTGTAAGTLLGDCWELLEVIPSPPWTLF